MRIKVFTKHYIPLKPGTDITPTTVHYDYEEEFIFIYENNLIKLYDGVWCKSVHSLEECFQAITSYFARSNYHIKDIVQMAV